MEQVLQAAAAAKRAAKKTAALDAATKNRILLSMAEALVKNTPYLIEQNELDLRAAEEKGTRKALLDRLRLTPERIAGMAQGLEQVAALADPIGEIVHATKRENGLMIGKKRVPLGVIGIIYEARPNVTADAIGLCLKTGNTVVLRGGSEAIHSNIAVTKVCVDAGRQNGLPEGAVNLIEDTSREAASYLMTLNDYLDVLIPRGGAGLIQSVVKNATIPVIQTGTGNCHIYVESSADFAMAEAIVINAKTQRPSVCNAAESLLVDEKIAKEFLPHMAELLWEKKVEIRGCKKTGEIIECIPATDEDFATEFLDYILSVKVVSGIDEAIEHIDQYGTKHSEAIITNDYAKAKKFQNEVDAAAVYVNASTRFTDGFEFGFGAEIGISTQKLHARGPMGLNELTTFKYIIDGDGQVRP